MLVVSGIRALKHIFSQHGFTSLGFRSLSSASHLVQESEDTPVQMENPYKKPEKGCILHNIPVDFRNIQLLSQFVSPHTGRIYGRHITRLCARKQRQIAKAIKRAQAMGFMSVTHKHPQFMKDPIICDIRHPM